MQITQTLAGFLTDTNLDRMPAEAVETAKLCITDWIAVCLAGYREPLADILSDLVTGQGSNPQATLVGRGEKTSALNAALVNGSVSHALDYDDVHLKMLGHPTVAVAPALFALGEWKRASGRTMLESFILGVETECRVSAGVSPHHYLGGWHATGTVGTFGAAAAAGKMLGLSKDRMVFALGLAGTQAAGLRQVFGTMAKPFHAGKAAFNGLIAALLAEKGFTCSGSILEGDMGFSKTMAAECAPEKIIEDLGERFEVTDVQFKWHASCFQTHPAIDAALAIENRPEGRRIREVTVKVHPSCAHVANIREPRTGLEGKFCIPYCTALAIAEARADESRFTDEMVSRPDLCELREKVRVVEDESLCSHLAGIVVTTEDGAVLEAEADTLALGSDRQIRKNKVREKFLRLSEPVIGRAKTQALLEELDNLENVTDVSETARLLSP